MNPDQLKAMLGANSQNSTSGALSQDQLQAMLGAAPNPQQSAQGLGHSNHLISTILSTGGAIAGGIGGALLGGAAGIETGPGAIATAYGGGVLGSGVGAAGGEALGQFVESKLGMRPEGMSGGEIAKQGIVSSATDAIGGPILSGGGKLLAKAANPIISAVGKGAAKVGELFGGKPVSEAIAQTAGKLTPTAVATSRVASTAANMSKGEREQAILQGRMTPNGKYVPSETEQNAGELLAGKTSSNPVTTLKAVANEIATRGQEAESYLTLNATKISNAEDAAAFSSARNSAEKYMTSAETNAYDEQVGVFQKILKTYTGEGGYTTANYYKALKDYESQVTANLPKGKDALMVPGGSARIQGAKDVREVVRNMIGDKNPEFKDKMYDLASLYGARDNVVANAEQGGASFAQRHPILTKIGLTGAGIAGYEEAKKLPLIGGLLP